MAKRYGRNQKRKAREEITRLSQSVAIADGLRAHYVSELAVAKETLREIISIIESVSRYSVALPTKTFHGEGERDRLEVRDEPRLGLCEFLSDSPPLRPISFKTINLYRLEAFLKERREEFSTAVHLQYSAGQHSAYFISESALFQVPENELIKRILPDIARGLVRHMRGKRPRERR